MSTIDIRNLISPAQVGVEPNQQVSTTSPTTVVGTPTPAIQNPFSVGFVANTASSVELSNGTSLNLPGLSQDDVAQVNNLFGGMSNEQLSNIHQASKRLASALFASVAASRTGSSSTMIRTAGATTGAAGSTGATAAAATLSGAAATSTSASGVASLSAGNSNSGGGATSGESDDKAASSVDQSVNDLTDSFYQTMMGTAMNVQPEDPDSDGSDDDSDDDSDDNSWGTTGTTPQMQNLEDQGVQSLQGETLTAPAGVTASAASTASAGATGTSAAASGAGMNRLTSSTAGASAGATASAAVASLATPAATANVVAAKATSSATVNLTTVNAASGATAGLAVTQAISGAAVATTQSKLLSPDSPDQAPVANTSTPEVYNAAANAVQTYSNATGTGDAVLQETGITASAVSSGSLDYDGSVNAVTYMGIIGLQNQLSAYAQQTQDQLNQLNDARTEYEDVNSAVANWPASTATQYFTWTTYGSDGSSSVSSGNLTYSQASALAQNLEDQVNGMEDTNQEQQLELQDLTQDYQQAVNTMSNLLKMDFDTVKAIINNIHS